MRKILSIISLVVFVAALSNPVFGDNPPKDKAKTETKATETKKTNPPKTEAGCSASKEKSNCATKCTQTKSTSCCSEKASAK